MPEAKKVKDIMIPLEDYPHIPYWFTLRQAMAMVREASLKFEGYLPRSVLVFDEKYHLLGMLTLRDIIRGLEPGFLKEEKFIKPEAGLTMPLQDLFGPGLQEACQKPVSEVMSPIKAMVDAGESLAKALFLMMKENVGLMPVMQEDKVAGMIRLSDLFKVVSNLVLKE